MVNRNMGTNRHNTTAKFTRYNKTSVSLSQIFFWNYKKNVLTNLLLINCLHNDREYSASQNGRSTLGRNFAKYLPIFTILSPTDSAVIVITEHLTAAYTRHYTTL